MEVEILKLILLSIWIVGALVLLAIGSLALYVIDFRNLLVRKMSELSDAVAGVVSAIDGVGTSIGEVKDAVSQVVEDLEAGKDVSEAIGVLKTATEKLGEISTTATQTAETLRAADPTPPAGD